MRARRLIRATYMDRRGVSSHLGERIALVMFNLASHPSSSAFGRSVASGDRSAARQSSQKWASRSALLDAASRSSSRHCTRIGPNTNTAKLATCCRAQQTQSKHLVKRQGLSVPLCATRQRKSSLGQLYKRIRRSDMSTQTECHRAQSWLGHRNE